MGIFWVEVESEKKEAISKQAYDFGLVGIASDLAIELKPRGKNVWRVATEDIVDKMGNRLTIKEKKETLISVELEFGLSVDNKKKFDSITLTTPTILISGGGKKY